MRVLTINCYYKQYSVGKIIKDIEAGLQVEDCEFVHCYECGEKSADDNAYRLSGYWEYRMYYVLAHLTGLPYAAGIFSNFRLKRIIEKELPDIVHIHCPNAFSINLYWLLNYLKRHKIATVITNHAEFFFTGNCAYAEDCKGYLAGCKACPDYKNATHSVFFNRTATAWQKMKRSFENFEKIQLVAVSPWAEKRIQESTICGELPCETIYNGVDPLVFHHMHKEHLLEEYGIGEFETVFVHVTSRFSDGDSDIKGGKYILQLAQMLQQLGMQSKILVVGPVMLSQTYDHLKNIIFVGSIEDQELLAAIYSRAALLIMTSKRETFGMTCVESMCCGTPVVGFKNGGTESMALSEYSRFVPYGDIDGLMAAVLEWSGKKKELFEKLCKKAPKVYGKETMAKQYYQIYEKMI